MTNSLKIYTENKGLGYYEPNEQKSLASSLITQFGHALGIDISTQNPEIILPAVHVILEDKWAIMPPEEILQAFRLYAAGEYGDQSQRPIISARFIHKVLGEYKNFKNEKLKLDRQKSSYSKTTEETSNFSTEAADAVMRAGYIERCQHVITTKGILKIRSSHYYGWLVEEKKIEPIPDDKWEELELEAFRIMRDRAEVEDEFGFKNYFKNKTLAMSRRNLAEHLIVERYFNEKIEIKFE